MTDDEFDDIARQVAERLAAREPVAAPHVPLSRLGHACRSVACAIGLGHLSNGADPKAVREHLAQLVDMSEHNGDDAHDAVLTKTLLAALAGKSRPVIAVLQSGEGGEPDDQEPPEAAYLPQPPGRPTEDDVREFKRRHKR